MARITYLGEGIHPPPQIEWEGVVFPLGEAVEVDDPAMVKKASANPHFKVEHDPPAPAVAPSGAKAGDDDENDDDDDDDNDDREPPHPAPRAHPARAHVSRKKK